jgi:predicted YcjX-like family ATPase
MLTLVDEDGAIRSNAANFAVMALASIRATEDRMTVTAPRREILYGQPAGAKAPGQWDPGGLPLDMPPNWPEVHFQFLDFEPQPMRDALHEGFPAINIGRAIDFLIGDDFK